jgi:tetratricopeptide (TPR) repeat protein
LRVSILELTDLVKQNALAKTGMHIYSLKSQMEKEKEIARDEAARKIDSLHFDRELTRLLHETDVVGEMVNEDSPHITPRLFQIIWLTEKYVEADIRLIETIRKSDELPWYEKSLVVSALTLSLLNCFDKEKFFLLLDFYDDHEDQVWQRALTGLVIALQYYGNRVGLYPSINARLEGYKNDAEFFSQFRMVLIQVFKARETERLTSKFKEEILPDVQRFESELREKLDLDSLIGNDYIEDKNPDWEKIFEDSPDLLGKIEKMSEMQMEGLDLFMGTFAMLKNFDFFRELSNWFRPFYRDNYMAANAIGEDEEQKALFLSAMEESFYMCNSDKYSFCFNISHLPLEQKKQVMNLFNMEARNLHEMNEEDRLLHKPDRENYIFTQYIQDLYRFFKLHPFRNDFRDIFSLDWDISNTELFILLQSSPEVLKSAGQFLFEKEHYPEAINLFRYLSTLENPEQDIIEKLAYSYQLLGDYSNALTYYRKAEIFESNRLWNIKKIIFCYRKLRNAKEALNWSREALSLSPDDVYLHTMAGNCHLDLEEYDLALDHYFRVEFLAPDNSKVLRPISWCCFVLNKLEIARSYMERIIESAPGYQDYVNAAHIEYCLQNRMKAMEYYKTALAGKELSFERLKEIMEFDSRFLILNGVKPEEKPLITDYLQYQ